MDTLLLAVVGILDMGAESKLAANVGDRVQQKKLSPHREALHMNVEVCIQEVEGSE